MAEKITVHEKYPEFTDDQRQFFDELITNEWGNYQNVQWDRIRKFEIDRLFEKVAPNRILDIGCGCGYHDVLMAEKPGVEEVVGIDYSVKSIETANRVYPNHKVRRLVSDIMEMPPGNFDMAVSFQVIEHLRDPRAFITACAGQVKAGGWVVVATPNIGRFMNRVFRLVGRHATMSDPQHYREYTPVQMRLIGEELGLRYQNSFGYGMSIYFPGFGQLIPQSVSLRMGALIPAVADCFCTVFKVT